jgi:putative flippase GtrA
MGLSSSSLLAYARTEETRKRLRYLGVSVVFVPIGQGLIQLLGLWLHNYTTASLLGAAIVTIPGFFANKYFVWRIMSRAKLRSQMLVFWVAMMLSVALATLFTHLVEKGMVDQTTLVRGVAVFLAQVLGFGIVWVGRYFMLDRWLFKLADHIPEHVHQPVGDVPTECGPELHGTSPGRARIGSEDCRPQRRGKRDSFQTSAPPDPYFE